MDLAWQVVCTVRLAEYDCLSGGGPRPSTNTNISEQNASVMIFGDFSISSIIFLIEKLQESTKISPDRFIAEAICSGDKVHPKFSLTLIMILHRK
jgi:hypothetical protein